MANVFTRTNDATPKPNRNTFDLSFVNNMTLKAGVITPCFLKEVVPGDSVQIDATFGFNFQPMVFPVQTDMQANLHFFYVRNRTLWDGWQDFITGQENLKGDKTPPYIMLTEQNRDMFNTCDIGDYLGVPTVFFSPNNSDVRTFASVKRDGVNQGYFLKLPSDPTDSVSWETLMRSPISSMDSAKEEMTSFLRGMSSRSDDVLNIKSVPRYTLGTTIQGPETLSSLVVSELMPSFRSCAILPHNVLLSAMLVPANANYTGRVIQAIFDVDTQEVVSYIVLDVSAGAWGGHKSYNTRYLNEVFYLTDGKSEDFAEVHNYLYLAFCDQTYSTSVPQVNSIRIPLAQKYDGRYGIENSRRSLDALPFANNSVTGADSNHLRISALPFRAVESVYNSFYRDDRNNPLLIDGKPYYNVFVQDKTGGADTNRYKLYKRNWEADVFTTALQSPTQGILPLVGVTATGNMTFADEDGKTYYLQAEIADDGTLTGIRSYSSDMPQGTIRAMVDTISTGISINDFRNVNAFQRWLEVGMRKGLRYKENIEAHFGASPTYSELDMPEFIGGMSRKVQMNRVVQSVDDTANDKPLGTLGGYATVLGDGGQKVSKYFDEHGWIIGFITITPKPVYSQQLSKQLLKNELLDHYFPEFAHITMQPILNQELASLQCTSEEGEKLDDVFGYQRAWYEYLSSVDEVHGDFRTSMRDYLIQRVFDGVPQLGEEFLTVGDEEVNAVFAVEDPDVDKIFGQLYFDVKMKRPIPAIGIPKLEA